MKKIPSFQVNHIDLVPGLYVSRKDSISGHILTTFDIRMKAPNKEPVMNTAEMHTMEHLAATFLRNEEKICDHVIYFGPMGCRTGFYLILAGDYASKDVLELITKTYEFIADYKGDIPGASARDCGNYLDMNLPMAKYEAKIFLENILYQAADENLIYPK